MPNYGDHDLLDLGEKSIRLVTDKLCFNFMSIENKGTTIKMLV